MSKLTGAVKLGAIAVVSALLTVGISVPAYAATTRTVGPGQQYSSIQGAIDASGHGDTVQVSAGTYTENIIINGRYISLVGLPGATIRAANNSRAVVFITNVPFAPSNRAVVTGFTITGGDAPDGHGGGFTIFNGASPLIYGNIIEGNRAAGYGGGIEVFLNSNPTIRNNTIRNNSAGRGGGAIFAGTNSSPVIYQNTITNNSTSGAVIPNGGSSGGGIYLENTSDPSARSYPVLIGNTISNNTADFAGGGIMVRTGASPVIEDNTISNNTASYGGGIHVESTGSSSTIASNTISGNRATANGSFPGSGFGGGIALYDSSVVTIRSNAISGNSASNGGGGISSAENANSQLVANMLSGNFTSFGSPSYQDGGGLYIANSTMTATNNQFVSNNAERGTAVAILDGAKFTMSHNTVVRNETNSDMGGAAIGGGAIFVRDQAAVSANLTSNILTQNQGWQIFEEVHRARLVNNLITAPTAAAGSSGLYYAGDRGAKNSAADINTIGNSSGNIDTSPGFTSFAGSDYSLASTSTAIGAAEGGQGIADDYRGAVRVTMPTDIGAYEYESSPILKQHVYRFWSESKRGHFYTVSKAERDQVVSSYSPTEWRYEMVAYDAFNTQVAGTIPLYRFYSQAFQGHFFTASEAEKDSVIASYEDNVWLFEGVAYYVYPLSTATPSRSVFRFWSPDNRHHFYTASEAESAYVQQTFPSNVWTYEGLNFRVPQ